MIDMTGPVIVATLAILGGAIGCGVAWMASIVKMSHVKSGHGRLILLSITPLGAAAIGLFLMFLMKEAIVTGVLNSDVATRIGFFAGFSLLGISIIQGMCAKAVINGIENTSIFGKTFASIAITESCALFVMTFVQMSALQ